MKKRLFLTLMVAILSYLSFATMSYNFEVDRPLLRSNQFDNNLPVKMIPGEPMIAFNDIRILLPEGHRFISANVSFGYEQYVEGVYIDFARDPQPISLPGIDETLADPSIYESDVFYPSNRYEILGVHRKNGHDILVLNVYPYSYNAIRSELRWFDSYQISIKSEYDNEIATEQNLSLVKTERIENEISRLVVNPELMNTYRKDFIRTDSILPNVNEPYQMIIISDASRETLFADYVDWKESHGITTGYFTTNAIYANYTGVDNQERIRNFIIDAYQTYSQTDTPLEYVILGGDERIIPIRGMYGNVGSYYDFGMPSDLYYSNLDGNWDANGNGIYGEIDDGIDWFAEVAIGRIPAFSDAQFQNFFHKSYHYADNNTYSDDVVYMMGENLDGIPTWGGDYKDQIAPYIPSEYHLYTLYERDGTFSSNSVVSAINNGLGIINHIGHANYFIVFGLNNIRIANLYNTNYGFAYTQGCYPAAFDAATHQESGCVGQNLVTASGGLFAFIGNTRYGWYSPGSTNGASQAFDITFFSGLYDHNIRELGHTLNYSKEELVNEAMTIGVMRWIYYQLILFGDPSIAVKDPNGNFPYVEPIDVVYDDVMGDNDGMVNPGETVNIYLELFNKPNWSDANNVTATISFDSNYINVLNETAYFGNITNSSSAFNTSDPFVIEVDINIPYNNYEMTIDVSAEGSGNATFTRTYQLPMPVTLIQNHWPWNYSYPINASTLFADFTGDGLKELIIIDALGNINLLDADANTVQDPLYNQENIWRSFAIGDVTNDGNKEIVISSRYSRIMALNQDGDLVFSYDDCGQQILTPVVADLNNDGHNQIISLGMNKELYVLDSSGNLSAGFPVTLPETSIADIAVADITNDNYKEIIIGALDGNIYVIRSDGSYHPDFPVDLGSAIVSAPIVLDNKRIAVGTINNELKFISSVGNILFGLELSNRIATEIIAADFNNDGELELAFATLNGSVHIIQQTGDYLDGWPVHLNETILQPPLAVDINVDNAINLIVYSSQGNVYALNSDGSHVDSFPFPLKRTITSPATIDDIDGDGDWEIIVATADGVFVIDSKHQGGQKTPWTMYRGNINRTGYYGDNTTLDIDIPISEYITSLRQNYPNPFNPLTRIDFSLSNDMQANLEVYNIKGQKVVTLINDILPEGEHTVVWNGINSQNRAVGSGIYFYKLTTPETTITRKMLLLK
ncbi:MAG: T9SS type A sorting domain-containing protein [Candidatus Cloacimonetes bacterium]|nr:T9SS type A sorting domain-containing protein [Candidatus Cloacimonadota bacterium]